MTAPPLTLAAYTDSELGEFYHATGDDLSPALEAWRRTIESELDRRDVADRAAKAARPRPDCREAVRGEWVNAAHAQFLRAESECRGELLNRRGTTAGVDPWSLWSGPEHRVDIYASEELREFFRRERRITVGEYQRQAAAGRREERETRNDRIVGADAPRPVRHESEAGATRAVPGARHDGDRGPVRPSRPGQPAGDTTMSGTCKHPWRTGAEMCADCPRRTADLAGQAAQRAATRLAERAAQRREPAPVTGTIVVREPGTVVRHQPPVDGAQVLAYVRAFIDRYARMPSEAAADVVALWIAHAHCREAGGSLVFESTPRLMLLSSEPGSGKTRVLSLARMLCGGRYGVLTEPTAWALAHIVGPAHEAAFIDEADCLFGRGSRKEAVRAVLNSGYLRDGVVAHMRGKTVEDLATFGPCAIAGLDVLRTATGASLEPLFTRSVVIRMRKSPDPVPQLDRTARQAAALLHTALAAWAAQNRDELAEPPALPDWLANRDGEVWGPILQVAEMAGGDWPNCAVTAAAELCGGWEQPQDDGADFMGQLAGLTAGW